MINKIVFFDYQSLTQQVVEAYYFERLRKEDFQVEYLDLSKLYYPNLYKKVSFDGVVIHEIESYRDIEFFLKRNNPEETLYISRLTFSSVVLRLFNLLKKHNCKLAVFSRGAFPEIDKKDWFFSKLFKSELRDYVRYIEQLFTLLLKKIRVLKTYDYVFNCGDSLPLIGIGWTKDVEKAKIVSINTADFDFFSSIKKSSVQINKDYVVFLDEYFPFHPDLEICNLKQIPPEQYYRYLNDFFSIIEKKYNTKVVIAAHPKAQKYKENDYFEEREVFFGKTAELVKYSNFVIAQQSTSIGFAILARKPLVFVNSLLNKEYLYSIYLYINNFSYYLNADLVYIDSEVKNCDLKLKVDSEKYDLYKYKYLTNKETEHLRTEDIFVESIKRIKSEFK